MLYTRNFFVHSYETDTNLKLSIASIMRYFEDVAFLQSEGLNIGMDYYNAQNVGWVIYKWKINIHRYPKFKDTVKVVTDPYAFNGFYATRHYFIYDENEELICDAVAEWLFIDTIRRRPKKVLDIMYEKYGLTTDCKDRFVHLEKLPNAQKDDYKKSFHVRQSDIDVNGHVNNIKYVEWALETLPPELKQGKELVQLKTMYSKEIGSNENIEVITEKLDDNHFRHSVILNEKVHCNIETIWK